MSDEDYLVKGLRCDGCGNWVRNNRNLCAKCNQMVRLLNKVWRINDRQITWWKRLASKKV